MQEFVVMGDYSKFFAAHAARMQQAALFVPRPDPTFGNPAFAEAPLRLLIVRLSPFRDVDRSTAHLFLFDAVRRVEPRAYVDLVFFPPKHDRRLLLEHGIPLLTGIQSWRSAEDFDMIFVSNAFVLEMINLPFLLRHSGWPVLAVERAGRYPPVILGGSNARAAQSLAPFVDGIFRGEAEEALAEVVRTRRVPAETVKLMRPRAGLLPLRYPILNGPEAGTARLQITYGCPFTCAFCFEGFDRKPYREIPADELIAHARRLKQQVGCEEIDLYSFNFNTHSEIARLIIELNRIFERVSFKSQRVDILAQTPWLLPLELAAGKRSFTLGIEGISERLRTFLNKSLATGDIHSVLQALLRERVREVKLFYVLTGYETREDLAEFRAFVHWLKGQRQATNPAVRIIFSVGFLVRMPGTPLEHDRVFLEEAHFTPILDAVKSVCEDGRFELRLATAWPEYVATQVLALGAPIPPDTDLCYDGVLSRSACEQIKSWHRPVLARRRAPPPSKLPSWKLQPPQQELAVFRGLMARKARLKPVYVKLHVPLEWSGATAESLNARMFAHLLQQRPELTDNLLAVREAIFTRRGWQVTGETVFALKAWEPGALGFQTLSGAGFEAAAVELREPGIGGRVQEWLRAARIRFSGRRQGDGYELEIAAESRRKRIVFEAYVESDYARLRIGPKCRFAFRQVRVCELELLAAKR
ncbi:MAG: radical SAM protein [Verrucomicrobiae bacterium]|nr:radical SAM protein [Verrucomicrobiae bacterium]